MTDTDKLKRLAEAYMSAKSCGEILAAQANFRYECGPEDVLALIAENQSKDQRIETQSEIIKRQAVSNASICQQRDEAVALLRGMDKVRMYDDEWAPVASFLARIDGGV